MDAQTLDRLAAAEAAAHASAAQVSALRERTAELEAELRMAVSRGASAAGAKPGLGANKRLVRAPADTRICATTSWKRSQGVLVWRSLLWNRLHVCLLLATPARRN